MTVNLFCINSKSETINLLKFHLKYLKYACECESGQWSVCVMCMFYICLVKLQNPIKWNTIIVTRRSAYIQCNNFILKWKQTNKHTLTHTTHTHLLELKRRRKKNLCNSFQFRWVSSHLLLLFLLDFFFLVFVIFFSWSNHRSHLLTCTFISFNLCFFSSSFFK